MSTDTAIYAAIVCPIAVLVITAITAGLIADHRIEDETEPDIATEVAWEDGYARPPAPVPFRRHTGAHARVRRAA